MISTRLGILIVLLIATSALFWKERPLSEVKFASFERSVYSQHGEDGVIEKIFELIEPTDKYCIEFGAGDGSTFSNVRHLIDDRGWSGLLIDGDEELTAMAKELYRENSKVKCLQQWVYPGNIETIFEDEGVPPKFDLLVIDIDSNDYYIWKVMHRFRPKVVMVEVNGVFAPPIRIAVEYSPFNYWDHKSLYFGASLQSYYELGKEKGYELIYVESGGVNAFFVDKKYYRRFGLTDNSPLRLYHPHTSAWGGKFIVLEEDLHEFVTENGRIRDLPYPYFNNESLKWEGFEHQKRFVLGR